MSQEEEKVEWYHDFNDPNYSPSETDLVALYYFEPAPEISIDDLTGRLASESSIGTWTTLETLDERIYGMRGRAFWTNSDIRVVKIAYPGILWEHGNIPQLLSGVAGNIFGMKAVRNLRLLDVSLPEEYLKGFSGPHIGTKALKSIFKKEGPLLSCVPKPKIGMTVDQYLQVAMDAYLGGIDCIKDDENLTSQEFNKFEKRVEGMAKTRDKAESETGAVKDAFINITAETHEMERRLRLLNDHGFRYCMIDVVTTGFASVQSLRALTQDLGMAIHAHRAMHATFTKHATHGISMFFLAKLLRLIGVDNLHIGTVVGKLDSPKQDVLNMRDLLLLSQIDESTGKHLAQDWKHIPSVVPVASGGLHPGVLPEVLSIYNTQDLALQVGGGIHGHPGGTKAGAIATVDAIDAWKRGITLEEKSEESPELEQALKKWGHLKPV
ncbi:MAG: type III ribulose-bisphosphate carboxylase [Candidatus Heimdallarchaeota archaeon]